MPLPSNSALVFRTDDATKWGTGKGARLTKEEIDNNFWSLLEYIASQSSNDPAQIYSITDSNGKLTITLTDGRSFGPFDLPESAFRWTGDFVAGRDYFKFDVLVASDGAYLVLQDHTSATTFDPAATNLTGPLYALMFPFQNIYDISFFAPGQPGYGLTPATDAMFALRFARDAFLLTNLPGSYAGFKVAATSAVSCDIYKNATQIGSWSSASGFTFGADVQFNANDVLYVMAPTGGLDATAKGLTMVFAARKGLI